MLFRIPGLLSPESLTSPQLPVNTGPRLDQFSGRGALPLPVSALEAHLPLMFDVLVPVPDAVAIQGANDAEIWQLDNWGTLANPEGRVDRIDDGRSLSYEFHTVASPPRARLFAVSRRFPDLTLSVDFAEPVSGCVGTFSVANEQILEGIDAETLDDVEYIMWEWFGLEGSDSRNL